MSRYSDRAKYIKASFIRRLVFFGWHISAFNSCFLRQDHPLKNCWFVVPQLTNQNRLYLKHLNLVLLIFFFGAIFRMFWFIFFFHFFKENNDYRSTNSQIVGGETANQVIFLDWPYIQF